MSRPNQITSSEEIPAIVFLVHCEDQRGVVARLSDFFYRRGFNMLDCQQHTDSLAGEFFMRVKLDLRDLRSTRAELQADFGALAAQFEARWSVHFSDQCQRMAIMVTKASHCLYDLLLRQREGELPCDIPLVVSNHPDLESVADQFKLPFHCLPVSAENKPQQEAALERLLQQNHVDLVVLARYMQILSPAICKALEGRVINIHHAFLPAFQGARPYQRAYERGVKMIGATAHYVIDELDQGPIIEQGVERVSHSETPKSLARIGRDVERLVLARAVKAHLERRVIIAGQRTIVFSSDP